MSAGLEARITAAESVLAEFRDEQAWTASSGPPDMWALRLAAVLGDLLAWLELERSSGTNSPDPDAAEIQAAFPEWDVFLGADFLWHGRLRTAATQFPPHLHAATLEDLAAELNDYIAGGGHG